jgi:hypothetical protein
MALLAGAAAVVLIVLLSGGDSDESPNTGATGPQPSAEETTTRSTPAGTTGAGTTDGQQQDRARRARRRAVRRERTQRRAARQQEQGRLGAQTGGSPAQNLRSTQRGARVATIIISGGAAVGGVQRVRFQKGKRIRIIVRSDTDEVVEIPGYGLTRRARAGDSARFYFEASKDGLFAIELARGQTRIGVLQID